MTALVQMPQTQLLELHLTNNSKMSKLSHWGFSKKLSGVQPTSEKKLEKILAQLTLEEKLEKNFAKISKIRPQQPQKN